jgi:hypothetical protein
MAIETAQSLDIERLYHYQSFQRPERLAGIFIEKKLYFSSLDNLNDPWDCRPFFRKSGLDNPEERERVITWLANADQKHNTSLSEDEHRRRKERLRTDPAFLEWLIDQTTAQTYISFKKQYRVYCLSKHPQSTLMWAHYGDSCRGVCLEFSARTDFFKEAMRVEYWDAYPHIDIAETNDLENAKTFIAKSSDWRYEGEFRLVVTQHPYRSGTIPVTSDGFVPLPVEALKSVILGPLMPPDRRETIRRLAKSGGWNVQVKEAIILRDRFGLEIPDVDLDSSGRLG